jgi:predicted dehydrogenase
MNNKISNFLIIGLGSIGIRHLQNLRTLGFENIIIVTSSQKQNREFEQYKYYTSIQTAIIENSISHAIVCTPTANHIYDLEILLDSNIQNIYLEKPISNNLDGLEKIYTKIQNCKKCIVGYDLHFDPGLLKIKEILTEGKMGKIFSINAVVGQYLPDWRPNQDYREGMSAKIEKGGGVMLDLIHEFDYLRWLIGKPKQIACLYQHNPSLEIETEDLADVLIQFENKVTGTIHLDYHQKKLVRNCMITCQNGTVFWDLTLSEVRVVTQSPEIETFSYLGFERNQRYLNCMAAFIDDSEFNDKLTTFDDALISLKMIVAAKKSFELKSFIALT